MNENIFRTHKASGVLDGKEILVFLSILSYLLVCGLERIARDDLQKENSFGRQCRHLPAECPIWNELIYKRSLICHLFHYDLYLRKQKEKNHLTNFKIL